MIGSLILSLAFLAQTPSVTIDRASVTIYTDAAVQITYGDKYVKITWASPSPSPTPTPPPSPPGPDTNPPAPTTQNPLWVIGVFTKSAPLAPGLSGVRDSKTLAGNLRAYDVSWRSYDVKDPLLAPWLKSVYFTPGLLIVEVKPDGASLYSFEPFADDATEQSVMNIVKKIRGKF